MHKEIKTVYGAQTYMSCNIISSHYTKFRLSSHKFLGERGRWLKPKSLYEERNCGLCKTGDIEDEYHMAMLCTFFKYLRRNI